MNKIIGGFLLALAAVFLSASQTHAQANSAPMIYVHDFEISTTTLIAGATVPGSAVFVNNSDVDIPDVSYIASIVGDYKDGDPYTIFDTQTLGKVFVKAHSEKKIQFAYKVPSYLNGSGYGMEITAGLQSGRLMGWGEKRVVIKGSGAQGFVAINSAFLHVGNEFFAPGTGPTIHEGESATIEINAVNKGDEAITLYPKLSIYNRTTDGMLVYSSSTIAVTLKKGEEKTFDQYMPKTNFGPGVYAFSLSFHDATGAEVSRPVDGRFIIAGFIASVQNVSVDRQLFKEGEYALVKVVYSGTPVDILRPASYRGEKADMIVKLFNQNDDLVGETTEQVSLDASSVTLPLTIPIIKGSHALRAEVEFRKEDKEIGRYAVTLSDEYDNFKGIPEINYIKSLYVVVALLIVLIAMVFMRKSRLSRDAGIALLIVSFGFIGATAIVSAGTYSGTRYSDASHTLQGPDIVVQSPEEGAQLTPGQPLSIQVRTSAGECNNLPADLYTQVSFNGVSRSASVSRAALKKCHKHGTCAFVYISIHQTFTGFTAPAVFGDKNINVYASTNWYYDPVYSGHSNYSFPVTVVNPDACSNIIGTQTFIPPGKQILAGKPRICVDSCPKGQHNETTTPYSCVTDCAVGQHWDAPTSKCISDAVDVCPNIAGNQTTPPTGQHIDPVTKQCVRDACPDGTHWDNPTSLCLPNDTCPANQHLDPVTKLCVNDACPTGNHRDPVSMLCVPNSADLCPNIPETQLTVPSGLHVDSATGNCIATCATGQHNDPITQLCVPDTGSCPLGQHMDSTTGLCTTDPVCPVDMHWDASKVACTPDVHYCPQFQHWDPAVTLCVPDTECTAGATCVSGTANKCGRFDGTTLCTPAGPKCVPLDPQKCTVCEAGKTLCRGVCVVTTDGICPVEVTCTTPSGVIVPEGESVVMYDIKRGVTEANNCSHHQERRTCELDPSTPGKGVLSGKPNPVDDLHIYTRCTPFFKEV